MSSPVIRGTLLAVVVVLAGCSGVFVSDPGPPTTRTTSPPPTDAGTTTADSTGPIGLTADGVSNPLRLASAHVQGLENRSFTVRDAQVVSAANGTVLARTVTVAQVSADRTRFNATRRTADGFLPLFADTDLFVYSNGTVTYVGGSTVSDVRRTPASQSAYSGASYIDKTALYTSFSAVDTEITGTAARNGTTLFRVAGTGGNYSYNEINATDVSVVALVDRQGVVHELHLEWRAEFGARTILVERDIAYRAIGETTVDRPDWADDGNATGGA